MTSNYNSFKIVDLDYLTIPDTICVLYEFSSDLIYNQQFYVNISILKLNIYIKSNRTDKLKRIKRL